MSKTSIKTLTFDHVATKLIVVIYLQEASTTVPSLATFKQRVKKYWADITWSTDRPTDRVSDRCKTICPLSSKDRHNNEEFNNFNITLKILNNSSNKKKKEQIHKPLTVMNGTQIIYGPVTKRYSTFLFLYKAERNGQCLIAI